MTAKRLLLPALLPVLIAGANLSAQEWKDPHRPPCADARCRRVQSFVKAHYCGESPYGNGPDDGCLIKAPEKPRTGVTVVADFKCEWIERKRKAQCKQSGQPSPVVRDVLTRELRRLGLPAEANGQTYFMVWKSGPSGWTLAAAYYSRLVGRSDIELCQVVVIIDQGSHVVVVRKVPFQKTDVDVPSVTQWSPIDLADADGDGKEDVILEGDDYEDHWLEVVSVQNGVPHTLFSGLGYYL